MILKGSELSKKIISELSSQVPPPVEFVVIQVGDDPVSSLYVLKKQQMACELGVKIRLLKLDVSVSEEQLHREIDELNQDLRVKGILVQMPLPAHIDRIKIAGYISTLKDVDGFHNILGNKDYKSISPTVLAIDELLDFYKITKMHKKILIVGGGFLVGQPLKNFWISNGLDVRILLAKDSHYEQKIKEADIVVVATGGGREFDSQDFKQGATVIDASTVSDEGKIRGDVKNEDWPENINLAPVPGGVGPVTVALLFRNFYRL